MTSLPDLNLLSDTEKDGLIRTLFVQLQELAGIVAELKGRLALNSANSSKPPSTNGFNKPNNKNRSTRGKSGKNQGGQKGHAGNHLKQVEHPEHTEICTPPGHCMDCGSALGEMKKVESRQVFDIPEIRPEVTEYQVYETRCTCGKVHRGAFPEGVAGPVQYGPVAKAMVVEFTHHEMQPLARTGKLMGTIFDLPMSDATVLAIQKEACWRLTPVVGAIALALKAAPAIHADETGMYVSGKCKWMHIVATESLTWMGAHDKRGKAKQNKAFNLLLRLRIYADDVWRFTENPNVPFTNNIAEQAVRMPKVKQKISGGFRTMEGLQIFCTIRSCLATMHKQGENIFDALIQAFRGRVTSPRFA